MNGIPIALFIVFGLISTSLLLLFKLNPFEYTQNPLKKRRLYLSGAKLKAGERIVLHYKTLFRQTGCTLRKFVLMAAAAVSAGFLAGMMLFSDTGLAMVMAVCLVPAPYFYLHIKSSKSAREEIEGLENVMSVITNSYAGCNDIIKAIEAYVQEKNQYIPINLRRITPFDEFVSEIKLLNPSVEHGLYRLAAKIKNRYFVEWTKMLILCYHDRRLKFALFPIIRAMNDAKTMQVESDSMMTRVWRDYLLTVAMMFSVIPMMRFANVEWFSILTNTFIGKALIVIMLLTALGTSFIVMKVTKPMNR